MTLVTKLSVAVFLLTAATSMLAASAQEVVDEGCISSAAECTCAESPATGDCTRQMGGGKCLQGDCNPSYKCDCYGYELCAINTCGKWTPAVSAILSRTVEFQCKYEADGSKCRSAMEVMDTMESAGNAKDASTKYVDEIAKDEMDIVVELKDAMTFKVQTLDAFRAVTSRVAEVLPEELEGVSKLADEVMEETKLIAIEVAEASEDANIAYEAMTKARNFQIEAEANEAKAAAEELAEKKAADAAKAKAIPCVTCDDLKARVKKFRDARRAAAKAAGTWTKKGRGAKGRADAKRKSAKKRKAKVQLTSAECIAKTQKILNRLGSTA